MFTLKVFVSFKDSDFFHVIFLSRQDKMGIVFLHGKKKQMGIPTSLPCQIIMSSFLGMYSYVGLL